MLLCVAMAVGGIASTCVVLLKVHEVFMDLDLFLFFLFPPPS